MFWIILNNTEGVKNISFEVCFIFETIYNIKVCLFEIALFNLVVTFSVEYKFKFCTFNRTSTSLIKKLCGKYI